MCVRCGTPRSHWDDGRTPGRQAQPTGPGWLHSSSSILVTRRASELNAPTAVYVRPGTGPSPSTTPWGRRPSFFSEGARLSAKRTRHGSLVKVSVLHDPDAVTARVSQREFAHPSRLICGFCDRKARSAQLGVPVVNKRNGKAATREFSSGVTRRTSISKARNGTNSAHVDSHMRMIPSFRSRLPSRWRRVANGCSAHLRLWFRCVLPPDLVMADGRTVA